MSRPLSELDRPLELELRCPVDTQVLPVLRTIVTALAGEMGFDEESTERIEMAVDEACANVIRHAYKHVGLSSDIQPDCSEADDAGEKCALWLRIRLDRSQLKICVIDRGIGIDQKPKGHSSVEEFARQGGDGGLGVYIINSFMDEVEFACPPESGTVLTMVKYLKSRAKPAT